MHLKVHLPMRDRRQGDSFFYRTFFASTVKRSRENQNSVNYIFHRVVACRVSIDAPLQPKMFLRNFQVIDVAKCNPRVCEAHSA